MEKGKTKIFGIGLNKTGTTTLAECGKLLGLRCCSCSPGLLIDYVQRKGFSRIEKKVEKHDFFEDWPWPLIYKDIDERFPGSKFILTYRKSEQAWFESLKKHSLRTPPVNHCRKLAYGFDYPHNHKKEHLAFYNEHNQNVREYFKDRSEDFLEICWEKGDDLQKLCDFLGVDSPDVPTPHANKASDSNVSWKRYWSNRLRAMIS